MELLAVRAQYKTRSCAARRRLDRLTAQTTLDRGRVATGNRRMLGLDLFHAIGPKGFQSPLHEGVGMVLAEETAKLLDHKGQIVLITIRSREFPELRVQLASFEKTLKSSGAIRIQQIEEVEPKDPKYGIGLGLSATRLLKIVAKHPNADAIVPLIGVPNFTPAELDDFSKTHPKFIAEVRSRNEPYACWTRASFSWPSFRGLSFQPLAAQSIRTSTANGSTAISRW
jgi:hypothetical protein